MDVVVPLANALRYGDVRGTDGGALRDVFDGIVVRILAGLVPACSSLDVDAAALMVERLTATQTALAMLDHDTRRAAFPSVLAQLADRHAMRHGLISGRATRLLHDAGHWEATRVEHRLSQALLPWHAARRRGGVRRRVSRRVRHGARPRHRPARGRRPVVVVAATRGIRVGRGAAPSDVRCLRTRRTTSDHVAAARRCDRRGSRDSAATSTPSERRRSSKPCDTCWGSRSSRSSTVPVAPSSSPRSRHDDRSSATSRCPRCRNSNGGAAGAWCSGVPRTRSPTTAMSSVDASRCDRLRSDGR